MMKGTTSVFSILLILLIAAAAFGQDDAPLPSSSEPEAATEAAPEAPTAEPAPVEEPPVVEAAPPAPQMIPVFTVDSWEGPAPRYIRLDGDVRCEATNDGGLACASTHVHE